MARNLRLSLVFLMVLLPIILGCEKRINQPPAVLLDPPLIVPRTSVGQLKAGMTLDHVIQLMGEPQRKTANSLEYTRLGFAVMPDADKVVQVIMCGDVTGVHGPLAKAFTARTKEGIGLNSTGDELTKAYGPPTSSQSFPGARESRVYDSLGITFSLEAGRIHHMIVRLTPQSPEPAASIEVK